MIERIHSAPIIFLDIDGVLNKKTSVHSSNTGHLDPHNIIQFNHIIRATSAKVVISSDWRWFYPWHQLLQVLREAGLEGDLLGTTSTDWLARSENLWLSRGHEIGEWLQTQQHPEKWIILDDCDQVEPYLDHLVQTDASQGLTEVEAQQAIARLL